MKKARRIVAAGQRATICRKAPSQDRSRRAGYHLQAQPPYEGLAILIRAASRDMSAIFHMHSVAPMSWFDGSGRAVTELSRWRSSTRFGLNLTGRSIGSADLSGPSKARR